MKIIARFIIIFYQKLISPMIGPRCRFYPTCSEYSKLCFDEFPFFIALWYSLKRIFNCHPFHEGGFDPPPCKDKLCH